MYVDDRILFGDTGNQILAIIAQLQGSGLNIEDQGHPSDYVGVNIKRSRLHFPFFKNPLLRGR